MTQHHLIDKCNGNHYICVIGEVANYYGVHEIIAFDNGYDDDNVHDRKKLTIRHHHRHNHNSKHYQLSYNIPGNYSTSAKASSFDDGAAT